MTYYIKKPSSLNSSVDVYYSGKSQGVARWTDKFSDKKTYKNNPTYLTKNDDGKNGGWAGTTVCSTTN